MTATRCSAPAVRAQLQGFGWRPVGRREPVVSGLDLSIEPGERVLLAGASGAGKTTVLRALTGALGTTIGGDVTGEVRVDGQVGLLLQNAEDAIVADRLGRDVAFGPENRGVPREEIWARVYAALEAVALPYGADRPTAALSGGERQRLCLAGVLAMQPGLLLLDEPTSMLDEQNASAVRRAVLAAVEATGATTVVVEHQVEPWLDHVDRVVVLGRAGQVVADATPEAFVRDYRSELGTDGVWMPGLPVPEPLDVPRNLVQPHREPLRLRAQRLSVDLRTRTLHGPLVTRAVDRVDAELETAATTAFTGASGAGKSTLVAAMAGLVRPASGRVAGTERPLHRWRSAELARQVGWVPQNPEHGFVTTRVGEEVAVTGQKVGARLDVAGVLEVFGLSHLAQANPYQLSGGEQRRLAMAASLAHRPGVLLLDEPTVGQDRLTWAAVAGWVASAADAGAAVGVATHDAGMAARADREVRLCRGQVEGP